MIGDNDDALESAEKNFKDIKDHLESGGKPLTTSDISNMGRCVIDGIKSGIEHNTDGNKEINAVLGVSLKNASETMKRLSKNLSQLFSKVKKGGK